MMESLKSICIYVQRSILRWVIVPFFISVTGIVAQEDRSYLSPRSEGLALATVASSEFDNPASLLFVPHNEVAISYSSRYMLQELSYLNGSFTHSLGYMDWGVQVNYFGFAPYNEARIQLSGARRLSVRWSLGVRVGYLCQSVINEEAPFSFFGCDVGATYAPHSTLRLGLLLHNIVVTQLEADDQRLRQISRLRLGASYRPDELFEALLEIDYPYPGSLPPVVRIAGEYFVAPQLPLRIGLASVGWVPSFGVGYRFSPVAVDVSAYFHARLGLSVGVGVRMNFPQ